MTQPTLIIFGWGYTTQHLLKHLDQNWQVWMTSRTPKHPRCLSFDDPSLPERIHQAQAILSSVPPTATGIDPVLAAYQTALTSSQATWIGYLSSTSVYGDHQGQWVDEQSTCRPSHHIAQQRFNIEQAWQQITSQKVHVFRLAGIYGPQRNCLEQIRQGKTTTYYKANHAFSRIHVTDIAKILIASMHQPTPGHIFNVSDNEPAPLHEVQQYGAQLLTQPPLTEIPIETADLSPRMQHFFNDGKKIRNDKIKQQLGIQLTFPNYRSGLDHECRMLTQTE